MVIIYFLSYLMTYDWFSWILNLIFFFILSGWSGIRWKWAIILVFAFEIFQMQTFSLLPANVWWTRTDTIMDVLFAFGGIYLGYSRYGKKRD